MTYFTNYQ